MYFSHNQSSRGYNMSLHALSRTSGSVRSLAEVAKEIAADELVTPRQRQEICSALRTLARAIGRRLEEIPANPRYLRERLANMTPAMANVSQGRWNNVLSLTRSALKRAGLSTMPGRSTEPLQREWVDLFRHLNHRRLREGLSRFARYCSRLGIPPSEVTETVATSFLAVLENDGLIRNPRQVHRTMCLVWNRAAEIISDWPPIRLMVPQYRHTYSLSWDAFPKSLGHEVSGYFERLSGSDLLDGNDFRPLRPATIKSYDRLLRAFLSALVHQGLDPQRLVSLADIVPVEVVKNGLRFFLNRSGGNKSKQAYNLARMLAAIARHWVKVDAVHLEQLRAICRRLDPGKPGLTDKNRDRLRQFDDPANVRALVTLPQRVFDRHKAAAKPSRADALAIQNALAVELLLMVPMRIGNLSALNLDHNIVRTRTRGLGVTHLIVPGEDVKNGNAIEAILPPETVKLLDTYIETFRPALLAGPSPFIFPNGTGGPKNRHTLGLQIQKFLLRECGLRVNVHLFRHIAAKLYLEAHPGAYGVIRLVHGHRSVDTTTRSYCGTENAAAMRHFDENVLRLRRQSSPLPSGRSRKSG
jgi:integrase